jgi:hypothetical protein
MLTTLIVAVVAFAAGVVYGRSNPTVLAAAQAALHAAEAEATKVNTAVQKLIHGV